jgi:glycosyltransferase involved in cell wall biosynthesis
VQVVEKGRILRRVRDQYFHPSPKDCQAVAEPNNTMINKFHVYLWEPETSPHKLPLFRELLGHHRVLSATYIAEGHLNDHRQREGWQTDIDDLPVTLTPTLADVNSIVEKSPQESIHIFSGMHWVPCIVNGLRAVIRHRRRFGILHEPRVLEGGRGMARLGHSWLTEGPLRRHASFVLAIGAHGSRWFQLTGYKRDIIFPFAYFLGNRSPSAASFRMARRAGPIVSFLGRLEKLKGIHLFLEAIPKIKNPTELYVAGHGTWSSRVQAQAGLNYLGAIKMAEVPYFLSNTDVLVLPSTSMDDGWGAVISEALMAGAAVVSSHKVGASMCLADETRGVVVQKLTGAALATAVDGIITKGLCAASYRKMRSEWADEHLSQRAGVEYLLKIFDHVFHEQARPPSFVLPQR